MIAGLPMYDRPELRAAHDRLWSAIRANLGFGPDKLSHPKNIQEFWLSKELLFGQTCGMPYRIFLHERLHLVGTPDYGLEGCASGYYRSAIIVHAESKIHDFYELDGKNIAFNDALSQSGWGSIIVEMETKGIQPNRGILSHSHASSIHKVCKREADFAAIDAHTWRLMCKYHPEITSQVRVIYFTKPTPGLPFVTAYENYAELIFEAVSKTIKQLDKVTRKNLGIKGMVYISKDKYLGVANPQVPSATIN